MHYISDENPEIVQRALQECDCVAGKSKDGLIEVISKEPDSIQRVCNWTICGPLKGASLGPV